MKNTVVIVDDTQLYQQMLKNSVEKLGFDTLLCGDGVEAIECLKEYNGSVVAVFLDIHMPQIDGISVLGHFHSNYPGLPVFIITGSEDAADKKSADGLGVAGFIKKPFTPESLYEAVKELLDNLCPPKRAAGY